MMQFENEQSLDKVSHLSKSDKHSHRPSLIGYGEGHRKLVEDKNCDAMYKTQPVVAELSPSCQSVKARI